MAVFGNQENAFSSFYQKQVSAAIDRFSSRAGQRENIARELKTKNSLELDTARRIEIRKSGIDVHDGLALERLIGNSDFLPISYFETGLAISKSICRIELHDRIGKVTGYGTGFMVSPFLMMTNNHVLGDIETARYSLAQFNYQTDPGLLPRPVKSIRLDPDSFFLADEKLDFSLVALERSAAGEGLDEAGFLKLIFESGKALIGEYVTIIQHPLGGPKSVVIRENRVVDVFDDFIHYAADTSEGSSGSAVFNDNWDVVAIHHAAIPDYNESGKFVANEGIRISSICKYIADVRGNLSGREQVFLDDIFVNVPGLSHHSGNLEHMFTEEPSIEWYSQMNGYDPGFLGDSQPVSLPRPDQVITDDVAPVHDGGNELKYTHFSIMMSKSRRLAYYTAVNIDGKNLVDLKRRKDNWYYDPRIDRQFQAGPEVYSKNDLDRGHLVRRLDPVWGENAADANEDTFHFTNCAPQHKNLNQKIWLHLEDYILENAQKYELKVTVFTGPVFRADDIPYRGIVQIPAEFWKIAVMVKSNGELSATAYLQTQKNLITDLEFAYGKYKTYQVSIQKLESLTDLHFDSLIRNDPFISAKGIFARLIEKPEDLRL